MPQISAVWSGARVWNGQLRSTSDAPSASGS